MFHTKCKSKIASLEVELSAAKAGYAAMEDTADKLKDELDAARKQIRDDSVKFFTTEQELQKDLIDERATVAALVKDRDSLVEQLATAQELGEMYRRSLQECERLLQQKSASVDSLRDKIELETGAPVELIVGTTSRGKTSTRRKKGSA